MSTAYPPRCTRGRLAPSPTGPLHLGNARSALVTWLSVRSSGGELVLRVEDLDGPRVVPGLAEQAEEDLRWLGLDWDESPSTGGPCAPYRQSERQSHYEAALRELFEADHLFPCSRSRKELDEMASAPHGRSSTAAYPRALRPESLGARWFEDFCAKRGRGVALRFRVGDGPVSFVDRVFATQRQDVARSVGDFVLKRRDGLYAYQLAVVVDDIAMGITEVVRGSDLLGSTPRQILLTRALRGRVPDYAHVPLVLNEEGEKLSKRDHALTLRAVAAAGVRAEEMTGYLAWSLGLLDEPERCRAAELVEVFAWERIKPNEWTMPRDAVERMLALRRPR